MNKCNCSFWEMLEKLINCPVYGDKKVKEKPFVGIYKNNIHEEEWLKESDKIQYAINQKNCEIARETRRQTLTGKIRPIKYKMPSLRRPDFRDAPLHPKKPIKQFKIRST